MGMIWIMAGIERQQGAQVHDLAHEIALQDQAGSVDEWAVENPKGHGGKQITFSQEGSRIKNPVTWQRAASWRPDVQQ